MTGFLTVTAVVCVVLFGLWRAWRRFADGIESQFERVTTVAAVTPYCGRLHSVDETEWEDEDLVEKRTEQLQALGFELIGDFRTLPEGADLRALTHPDQSVYAIIQQIYSQPLAVELLSPYTDGRFVSFTDGPPARWPDPPTHPVTCCPGVRPKELHARLVRERPAEGLQATPAEPFPATYLRARKQAMAWMMERGGPTEAEIRDHLTEFPLEAAMQTMVSMTRQQWQSAMSAALQDQLREQFVATSGATDANGEPWAERLVAVHDRMTASELADLLEEAKDALEEEEENWDADDLEEEDAAYDAALQRIQKQLARSTPRPLFAQLNSQLDTEIQLKKVGEAAIRVKRHGEPEQPLTADVYLRHRAPVVWNA